MTDQLDLDAIEAIFARRSDDLGRLGTALVAEVKRLRTKLAAVESLIPNTDEEFPIFPYQLRAAIGARVEDYVLVPAAGLRVGRSVEAERDAALAAVERVRAGAVQAIMRVPRRTGQPFWSRGWAVAQAAGFDVGLAVAADAVRALDPGAEQDPQR